MDIKPAFITVTEKHLPETSIVLDRFYLVHDANRRLNKGRGIK